MRYATTLLVVLVFATGCQTQAEREEAALKAWWDSLSPTSGIRCHEGTFENFMRSRRGEPRLPVPTDQLIPVEEITHTLENWETLSDDERRRWIFGADQ